MQTNAIYHSIWSLCNQVRIIVNMSTQTASFAPGFGARLREERKRLGLSQEGFAERVGVKRLAQSQYELEIREPRLSYFAAIGALGANLYYLFYGKPTFGPPLSEEETRRIEKRVFDLIEEYVAVKCAGALSAESRYVLFEVMRAHCVRAAMAGGSGDEDMSSFLPGWSGTNG